jgi:4-hydroxy-2-oxoheptanedioate aldolase
MWSNRPTLGLWHRLATQQAAGLVGAAGYDWVCVDAQHGFLDEGHVRDMLAGLNTAGCPSIVRAPWHDPGFAMRALDAGAGAILFPTIEDPEQTARAVRACRYPPAGYRSWAGLGLGCERPETANKAICCGVMIETASALENLESILDVQGLDFAFVGPEDLALSLGYEPTTEPSEPVVLDAIERIRTSCRERNLPVGIYCGSPAMVRRWGNAGFRILTVTSDIAILTQGALAALMTAREHLAVQ